MTADPRIETTPVPAGEVPEMRTTPDEGKPAPELWAVHATGMDDLHPCASRRLAVRNATWLNLSLAGSFHFLDEEVFPLVYNVPVVWDGTPELHAEYLAAEDAGDARWSDLDADVIGELMAANVAANTKENQK